MKSEQAHTGSIADYFAAIPPEKQRLLEQVRATIRAAAPEATEKISYQMPTFYLNGNLVHYAALKNHIGFYPTSSGIREFMPELARYETTPGAVKFPLDEPLPLDLISRIVKFRVAENLWKAEGKSRK